MAGRESLGPLSAHERRILAAMCALADAGKTVTAVAVARRTGELHGVVHHLICRLVDKGWVARQPRRGSVVPLRIVARPRDMRLHPEYGRPVSSFEHRHPEDRPARRKCLRCGDGFRSDGWGNRLCGPCRTSAGRESWMGEAALP